MNDNIPHGTPSAYSYWKCRCDRCKLGHAMATKRYRHKKFGVPVPKSKPLVFTPAGKPQKARPVLTTAHRWTRECGWHIPR